MIDTLTLTTTAYIPSEALEKLPPPTTFRNIDVYNCYRYQKDNYHPLITYTAESRKLKVVIPSVPRFTYNTKLIMMDDNITPLFYFKLRRHLVELGIEDLAPPTSWTASSMDIYHDFQVGENTPYYIEAFKQIKVPKYKEGCYGNETVFWHSGSKDIKFYDKGICALDKHEPPEFAETCQGVMRFEVKINAHELRRYVGSDRLGDVFRESIIIPLLQKHLDILDINNLCINNAFQVLRILQANYSAEKARTLWCYMLGLEKGVDLKHSRMTEYQYRKDITEVGLVPVIGTIALSPLVIGPRQETMVLLAQWIAARRAA